MIDYSWDAISKFITPITHTVLLRVTTLQNRNYSATTDTPSSVIAPTTVHFQSNVIPKETRVFRYFVGAVRGNGHFDEMTEELIKWEHRYVQRHGVKPVFQLEVNCL